MKRDFGRSLLVTGFCDIRDRIVVGWTSDGASSLWGVSQKNEDGLTTVVGVWWKELKMKKVWNYFK